MSLNDILEKCIDNKVTDAEDIKLLKDYGFTGEDATYRNLVVVSLIKQATRGDFKALNIVVQMLQDLEWSF